MTRDTEDVVARVAEALWGHHRRKLGLEPSPFPKSRTDYLDWAQAALEASDRQSLFDRIDVLEGAVKLAVAHLTNAAAFAEGLGWLAVASEKREIAAEVSAALHQEGIRP